MRAIPIHFLAVLGAAIAKMVLGALWYSPVLFLRPWRNMTGITEEQMKAGMGKALVVDFVGSLVMAFVLVHVIRYAGATTVLQGLAVGFFCWLGFVAVTTISTVTYERKPFKLFLLSNGYLLISLLAMGAILAVWG
ncbi:MAG: DUF1761 domain-containing protein [Candidatus Entotheonellia bacterium]